jgi:hypothetical protein
MEWDDGCSFTTNCEDEVPNGAPVLIHKIVRAAVEIFFKFHRVTTSPERQIEEVKQASCSRITIVPALEVYGTKPLSDLHGVSVSRPEMPAVM